MSVPWSLYGEHRGVTALDDFRFAITFPDSSAIQLAVYNILTGDLALRYSSGGEYVYEAVLSSTVLRLMVSKSAGSFVNSSIKGEYKSRRIYPDTGALARMRSAV